MRDLYIGVRNTSFRTSSIEFRGSVNVKEQYVNEILGENYEEYCKLYNFVDEMSPEFEETKFYKEMSNLEDQIQELNKKMSILEEIENKRVNGFKQQYLDNLHKNYIEYFI